MERQVVRALSALWLLFAFCCVSLLAPNASAQPAGSYRASCQDYSVRNDTLVGRCKDRGGNLRDARLDAVSQCISEVINDDGALRCNKGRPPPGGSYTRSCENITTNGTTLNAACRDRGGAVRATSLDRFDLCVGEVQNLNGVLRCSRAAPPVGSYTQSCEAIWVENNVLHAFCRGISGGMGDTALADFAACRSPVTNVDGQLTCEKGTSNAPGGSYLLSCRSITMNGAQLSAECRGMDIGYRRSALDITGCRSGVTNIDGFLTCNKGDPAPAGSYMDSCIQIVTHGTQLQAQCRTKNRTFVSTSLNFAGCPPGKIDNLDGVLTCNIPPVSPTITVTRIESASTPYEVTGSGFKGGSTVRIRVVSTPPNEIDFNNSAKVDGTLDAKVNPGCATNIVLHFSATDGRPNTHDLTGVLWSNTFNVTCP